MINKLLKVFDYVYHKLRINFKIASLNIIEAAIEDTNTCYVKISNGVIFYGPSTKKTDKKYYNLLPGSIKSKLPFACYQVAQDIIIRYIEKALKVGGPKKEKYYTPKKGDVVAEMGAFRGYYCLNLAQLVGENGMVIAIEPMEDNLYYLRKNIEANNINNVFIVPKGVWNKPDNLTFHRNKGDFQSNSIDLTYTNQQQYSIEVDSLDNILSAQKVNNVQFMVIQLNGAEIEATQGLSRILPTHLSYAARYKKNNVSAGKVIKDMLTAKGYKVQIHRKAYVFAKKEH